jgi:hypothetical protein
MAENDRRDSQKSAADNQGNIGQKERQQHQCESAKHRCPVAHSLAVSEDDETERAEKNASDAVQREEVRHIGHTPFHSLSQAKPEARKKLTLTESKAK